MREGTKFYVVHLEQGSFVNSRSMFSFTALAKDAERIIGNCSRGVLALGGSSEKPPSLLAIIVNFSHWKSMVEDQSKALGSSDLLER